MLAAKESLIYFSYGQCPGRERVRSLLKTSPRSWYSVGTTNRSGGPRTGEASAACIGGRANHRQEK